LPGVASNVKPNRKNWKKLWELEGWEKIKWKMIGRPASSKMNSMSKKTRTKLQSSASARNVVSGMF
jgi:hypothetical protein